MRIFVESVDNEVVALHISVIAAMESIEMKVVEEWTNRLSQFKKNRGDEPLTDWRFASSIHPPAQKGMRRMYYYSNTSANPHYYEFQEFEI